MTIDVGKNRFYAVLILLLLLATTILLPFYARPLVDIFATGYSDVKLYAFPLFAFAVCIFYFSKIQDSINFRQRAFMVFAFIVVLYAANTLFYAYLTASSGVENFMRYYVVRDGFISSNLLDHMHSFKPIVGWPLELFPEASYQMDFGYPFMAYIPFYAYIPLTIVFLYLLYQLCKFIPEVGARFQYSIGVFLLFTISLFAVVKNIADGGLTNIQLAIPLAFFTYSTFFKKDWPRARRIAALLTAFILIIALQFCIQSLLITYFSKEISIDILTLLLKSMLSDSNLHISAALYLIIYLSFKPLDRNPNLIKMISSIVLFIITFIFLSLATSYYNLSESSLAYSTSLLEKAEEKLDENTPLSFLTQRGLAFDSPIFTITHAEPLKRHSVMWGYTTKPITGLDFFELAGTPAGRKNKRTGCEYKLKEENDVILFKLYGFDPNVETINNSLISISKTSLRTGEYRASMRYCMPSEHIVLMEILSMYDDKFIADIMILPSKQGFLD
ncbi:MAG: hypothetical protein V1703_02710 [Candidatus Altiarchaeota archaeon]